MPRRSEASVVKGLLKCLNSLNGCYAKKRHGGPNRRGEPDITGCYRGRRIEIEAKALGNKATKLQKERLNVWKNCGSITGIAYDEEDLWIIMKDFISIRDKRIFQNILLNGK
jgi:hypothetical protein